MPQLDEKNLPMSRPGVLSFYREGDCLAETHLKHIGETDGADFSPIIEQSTVAFRQLYANGRPYSIYLTIGSKMNGLP